MFTSELSNHYLDSFYFLTSLHSTLPLHKCYNSLLSFWNDVYNIFDEAHFMCMVVPPKHTNANFGESRTHFYKQTF